MPTRARSPGAAASPGRRPALPATAGHVGGPVGDGLAGLVRMDGSHAAQLAVPHSVHEGPAQEAAGRLRWIRGRHGAAEAPPAAVGPASPKAIGGPWEARIAVSGSLDCKNSSRHRPTTLAGSIPGGPCSPFRGRPDASKRPLAPEGGRFGADRGLQRPTQPLGEPKFGGCYRARPSLPQGPSHPCRRDTAAFARPGPGAVPFTDVTARMQPSDSLIPFGFGSGRPSPSAYLAADASFVPLRVHPRTRNASEMGHRLSVKPVCSRGGVRASQVSGSSPSCVPWSKTPPGAAPSSPLAERPRSPSGGTTPWAPGTS